MISNDLYSSDADYIQQGPYFVDVTNKFTQTAEVLWRKGDGMATLWVREHPDPCLNGLLSLSGSITLRKVLILFFFKHF